MIVTCITFNKEGNQLKVMAGVRVGSPTCFICLGVPVSPKVLHCQHIFCEQCISEYIVTIERQTRQKIVEFPCPVCRTAVTPPNAEKDSSEWATDLADMENKSEPKVNGEQTGTKRQECDVCKRTHETTAGTRWCRECQELMCDVCAKYHGLMKQLQHHNVIQVDPYLYDHVESVEPNVSDNCSTHDGKPYEAYCFDHELLCCVFCLTRDHRACKDVREVDEIIGDNGKILENTKEASRVLLEAQKSEREAFEESCKKIEQTMDSSVKMAKDNLDVLMISFRKELHLNQDDYLNNDHDIKQTEKFLRATEKALENVAQIRNYGTSLQIFRNLHKTRGETKNLLSSLMDILDNSKHLTAELILDPVLENILKLDKVGKVEIRKSESKSVEAFRSNVSSLVENTVPTIEDIEVTGQTKTVTQYARKQLGTAKTKKGAKMERKMKKDI